MRRTLGEFRPSVFDLDGIISLLRFRNIPSERPGTLWVASRRFLHDEPEASALPLTSADSPHCENPNPKEPA